MLESASIHEQKRLPYTQCSGLGGCYSGMQHRQITAGFEWHIHLAADRLAAVAEHMLTSPDNFFGVLDNGDAILQLYLEDDGSIVAELIYSDVDGCFRACMSLQEATTLPLCLPRNCCRVRSTSARKALHESILASSAQRKLFSDPVSLPGFTAWSGTDPGQSRSKRRTANRSLVCSAGPESRRNGCPKSPQNRRLTQAGR